MVGMSERGLRCPFSSLLIGMCFATCVPHLPGVPQFCLSVPFSSGCALRPRGLMLNSKIFVIIFQFPSHRDVLCDQAFCDESKLANSLSVPFSSGCALRHADGSKDCLLQKQAFSSLLIGMCFATRDEQAGDFETLVFQFPSHRDVLCDGICTILSIHD